MRKPLIILAACLALAACGKSDKDKKEVIVSDGNGAVSVTGNGEHMTIKSDDGKTTVNINANGLGDVKLPDYAPLYPGAKTQGMVTAKNESGGTVAFETGASPQQVIDFYKQKTAAAGLAEKMNMAAGTGITFMASDDKKTLQVVAAKTDSGSHVQIFWGRN